MHLFVLAWVTLLASLANPGIDEISNFDLVMSLTVVIEYLQYTSSI